ncbi:putative erythromycin esterase [Violaceomyces palustris]|uniref:Erythromycin esterase n=1 Tax=Violaceomyces palustris TaxID=1673888 RepID=A0ACD0P6U7_9BASI|nr:putative erythromycin esterase [Violaceomyces palustris]
MQKSETGTAGSDAGKTNVPSRKGRVGAISLPEVPIEAVKIKEHAVTFDDITSEDEFGRIFDSFKDCQVVLIGDGTHGTSEFYTARATITQRLISHHSFNVVAVEADFPDAEYIDRYVRQRPPPEMRRIPSKEEFEPFRRFPTWMWRNKEVQAFIEWLRNYNASKRGHDERKLTSFFGLDLYSLGASLRAVIDYLEVVNPQLAEKARERYGHIEPWIEEPTAYGLASLHFDMSACEREATQMLKELLEQRLELMSHKYDGEEFHSAEQNAALVADAEAYYRAMFKQDENSWNLRDKHMFSTLKRIIDTKGKDTKVVIWAHNSHCGDARDTSMGWKRGELNIGQLCREHFGQDHVGIIGFGTETGTVAAARNWDGDMVPMKVNPSRNDSFEHLFHLSGLPRAFLDLREGMLDEELRKNLMKVRLERFIGVVYKPATERWSHYSSAKLSRQFDAYVWIENTHHVEDLVEHEPKTPLAFNETYPFGL